MIGWKRDFSKLKYFSFSLEKYRQNLSFNDKPVTVSTYQREFLRYLWSYYGVAKKVRNFALRRFEIFKTWYLIPWSNPQFRRWRVSLWEPKAVKSFFRELYRWIHCTLTRQRKLYVIPLAWELKSSSRTLAEYLRHKDQRQPPSVRFELLQSVRQCDSLIQFKN